MKIKALIIDLDGTLFFFDHHRGPFEDQKAENDLPNKVVHEIIERFKGDHKILLVSGRDEGRSRIPTEKCLLKYGIIYDQLWMRPAGSIQSDVIVKRDIYNTHIKENYDVLFAVDDRPKIIRLWRDELKIPTLDVGKGIDF